MTIQKLIDDLRNSIYPDAKDLLSQGKCIQCKELALPKCYSGEGRKEYSISGLCEVCFDSLFNITDENEE